MAPWTLLLTSSFALAGEPATCPDTGGWLDGEAHLRALSLDLRGVVPDPGEVALVDGEVPDEVIDAWLASDGFADRTVRLHRNLLWNNVSGARALPNPNLLSTRNGIWWARTRSAIYRGAFDVDCGTFPATFDSEGVLNVVDAGDGTVQEGWVWVSPYWAPDTPVQICAFDAAEARYSPLHNDCATSAGFTDPGCGCGPDMQWCAPTNEHARVMQAFGEDIDRRVAAVVQEDRPWTELLTGTTGFVNGPISYFLRHQTQIPGGVRFSEQSIDPAVLPDLDFSDESTWVEVDLGTHHSGVLTAPGFLLRFQTGRARANQFYNSFLCQPFQPPATGLPHGDGRPTLDLTAREGCKYCHALLEPAAAHWGRWTPFGSGYLSAQDYADYEPSCAECATGVVDCSEVCNRYYVVRSLAAEQDAYLGWLSSFAFLEPRHESNVDVGPRALVEQGMLDGRLPECAATQAATWLLGRPPLGEEQAWVESLARDFVASDYSWRTLVKRIVTSSEYRSVQ